MTTAKQGLANRLAVLESVIERGLATFVEVGTALATIRDERLYLAHHSTFEDYCREAWGFSDRRARQMIDASEAAGLDSTIVESTNEAQAREVAAIIKADGPERAAEILTEVAEDGPVTAKAIREAARPTRADIIAEYPALDVPDAADADVARVAEALSKIPQHERDERAENGRRWLVAKASGALDDIAKDAKREAAEREAEKRRMDGIRVTNEWLWRFVDYAKSWAEYPHLVDTLIANYRLNPTNTPNGKPITVDDIGRAIDGLTALYVSWEE